MTKAEISARNKTRWADPEFREKHSAAVKACMAAAIADPTEPAEARQRIPGLVRGPYLELFARSRAEGWDAWGAEVGKFGEDGK